MLLQWIFFMFSCRATIDLRLAQIELLCLSFLLLHGLFQLLKFIFTVVMEIFFEILFIIFFIVLISLERWQSLTLLWCAFLKTNSAIGGAVFV